MQNPALAQAMRRQKEGAALMQQGGDTSPIRSPWQGVARLAQALLGGYEARKGDEAIKGYGEQRAKQMEALFADDPAPPAQAPAAMGAALSAPAQGQPMPQTASPDLLGMVTPIAQKYGVPVNVALALIQQESGGKQE
jgi:soluble lytic murein transglycosylase-like protein